MCTAPAGQSPKCAPPQPASHLNVHRPSRPVTFMCTAPAGQSPLCTPPQPASHLGAHHLWVARLLEGVVEALPCALIWVGNRDLRNEVRRAHGAARHTASCRGSNNDACIQQTRHSARSDGCSADDRAPLQTVRWSDLGGGSAARAEAGRHSQTTAALRLQSRSAPAQLGLHGEEAGQAGVHEEEAGQAGVHGEEAGQSGVHGEEAGQAGVHGEEAGQVEELLRSRGCMAVRAHRRYGPTRGTGACGLPETSSVLTVPPARAHNVVGSKKRSCAPAGRSAFTNLQPATCSLQPAMKGHLKAVTNLQSMDVKDDQAGGASACGRNVAQKSSEGVRGRDVAFCLNLGKKKQCTNNTQPALTLHTLHAACADAAHAVMYQDRWSNAHTS
eukprot:357211-Chlamydomonas_euryale.AAC.6